MAAQNCSQCNAPLPLGPPGTIVTCRYCGAENTIDDPARRPPPAFPQPPVLGTPAARAKGSRAGLVFGLIIAVTAGAVALAVTLSRRSASSGGGGEPATSDEKRGLPLSKLAGLAGESWEDLEAPPFTGTLDAFPPSANLEWALTIGRAWSNDAVLTRVDIAGVTRDGKLDLRSEDEPDFDAWFVSPARLASAESLAQVSDEVPPTSLRLWIHEGRIRVMQDEDRRHDRERVARPLDAGPPANSDCSLARVLELAAAHGLARRPHYRLLLEPQANGRWAWRVMTEAGDDSRPPPVLLDSCKAPAELPEPGAEDAPDDGRHEPFDWGAFRPVAGCECPGDPPLRLAVLRRSASFVKLRDGVDGSFGLAWILRAGDATPWRLPVDDRETAPSDVLSRRIEDSMAMACEGDRVFVVADGHASAWSRSERRVLWSVPVAVPPATAEAVPTEVPVEPGDFSLVFRCAPAALADEVLSVPLADGTTLRLSATDGTVAPDPAAPAAPAGESAPAPPPPP